MTQPFTEQFPGCIMWAKGSEVKPQSLRYRYLVWKLNKISARGSVGATVIAPLSDSQTLFAVGSMKTIEKIEKLFFILEKKKKVPSNTFTERETQEKEETTQRQSVKTCDMKIVVHTHKKNKNNTHGRDT